MRNNFKVGLYAWAGPGTIRILQTKYHAPRIRRRSFLTLYDPPFLETAQELFGVTDMWVSYSWGFSGEREKEDYRFLRERLKNFRKLGIRTHAYVQGFNVVTEDWKDHDVFCRDPWGRLLPYSRGRSFTCPNNPAAINIIMDRVARACREKVDGIFLDNLMFGQPPFMVRSDRLPFFGCSCRYCQQKFRAMFGYSLPLSQKVGRQVIGDYLSFRVQSVTSAIATIQFCVHSSQKIFGANLYDPFWHTPELFFGYSLKGISPYLDYFLIENHALKNHGDIDNSHLRVFLKNTNKPVFIVSYKKGIGYDCEYSPTDIDAIFSESRKLGYKPCLKATEFITDGVWHALRPAAYKKPKLLKFPKRRSSSPNALSLEKSSFIEKVLIWWGSNLYIPFVSAGMNNNFLVTISNFLGLYTKFVTSCKTYAIGDYLKYFSRDS